MAVLIAQGLGKAFGIDQIFADVSFVINEGERLGLVGRNGSGKTTLLRTLAGRLPYDQGRLNIGSGVRVGYLTQDPELTPGRSLEAEAASAFELVLKWEQDLRRVEAEMTRPEVHDDPEQLEAAMQEYSRLTALFEGAGGYDYRARVKMVLFGLGFSPADLEKPTEVLSGGQKVRAGLAKLLLEAPELLLLDEPTNHLDLQSTEWLEGYLKQYKGAAIIVSHDRYFLDALTTKTLELAGGRGTVYTGNYSRYLELREARLEGQEAAFKQQQAEIKRLQGFITKFQAGTRARQAASRQKQLDRMVLIERPEGPTRAMGLNFDVNQESADDVLKIQNLSKAFGDQLLFSGVNLEFFKGDRVALVGPNGCGKTTLLRILEGVEPPSTGSFLWGVGVEFAYFSQGLDQIDHANTVLEEILTIPGMTIFEARSLLGRFLFRGDEVERLVGDLSGGERNRLTLAKLMVSGANVLLLDEPTNHLDLASEEVLEEALRHFPGTLFVVSHDRFFLDRVANKVLEFEGGQVTPFEGNYSAYRAEKARLAALAQVTPAPAAVKVKEESRPPSREQRRAQAQLRELEAQIEALEGQKAELEAQMNDPATFVDGGGREVVAQYRVVEAELEKLVAAWARLGEELL